MEKKLLTTDEIKKCELSILLEFDRFCKKNKLTYFLTFGTLLGAIRHKGFIPWDDDIDVSMPRPDYEKFYELTKNKRISENIEMTTYRKCLNRISYPFIKLFDITTIVEENGKSTRGKSHIWIDVFPIDGFSNDEKTNTHFLEKIARLRRALFFAINDVTMANSSSFLRFFIKKIKQFFYRCSLFLICKKIDLQSQKYSYETAELVGCIAWSIYGNREIISKSHYSTSECNFEGYTFSAPKGWHEYLSNLYGEYMQLPPIDKRGSHAIIAYMK